MYRRAFAPRALFEWQKFREDWLKNRPNNTASDFKDLYPMKIWIDEWVATERANVIPFIYKHSIYI